MSCQVTSGTVGRQDQQETPHQESLVEPNTAEPVDAETGKLR